MLIPTSLLTKLQGVGDAGHIGTGGAPEAESCDLDENTVLDLYASGGICGITVEHAKVRADLPQCSFEQVGV